MRMKGKRKLGWIGLVLATGLLLLRLGAPRAGGTLRSLLVDPRGEAAAQAVYSAFSGGAEAVPVSLFPFVEGEKGNRVSGG